MGFIPLWGVGKDARSTISPVITDTGTAVMNFLGSTTTQTTALVNQRVLFIWVSLSMKQDVAGTAQGQFFNVLLDSKIIASYAPSSSTQTDWIANDVIPVDIEAINSNLRVEFGASSETGDYGIVRRVQVYGIAID